jgi:hypothetical protein
MSWLTSLSPLERLERAKEKTSRLIDHISEVIRLNESNRMLVYSNAVSKQIPVSYAAHAFNELSRAQHFFEIARLCALWDPADEHRDSIPTVFGLLAEPSIPSIVKQQIRDSWGEDARGFAQGQADAIAKRFERAERLYDYVVMSNRLKGLRNFRHKFIAHALTVTNAEAKGAVIAVPKYGQEGRLLRTSTHLVQTLYLALANTDFAFDMTVTQARRNAAEFWSGVQFSLPRRGDK